MKLHPIFYVKRKPMRYNVNHNCWVKLTERGRLIFLEQINSQCPYDITMYQWKLKMQKHNDGLSVSLKHATNSEGYTKMQMHALMKIFGPHINSFNSGKEEPAFETEILIDRNGFDMGMGMVYRRRIWFCIVGFFPNLLKSIRSWYAMASLDYYLHGKDKI